MSIRNLIKTTLKKVNLYVFEMHSRQTWTKGIAQARIKHTGAGVLSPMQKKLIEKKWGKKYLNSIFYKVYSKTAANEIIAEYIPDDIYMGKLEPYFNKPLLARQCEDKNLYDLFFTGIRMPKTIARYIDGLYLDENYKPITEDDVFDKCSESGSVIIKIASESGGGMEFSFGTTMTGRTRCLN